MSYTSSEASVVAWPMVQHVYSFHHPYTTVHHKPVWSCHEYMFVLWKANKNYTNKPREGIDLWCFRDTILSPGVYFVSTILTEIYFVVVSATKNIARVTVHTTMQFLNQLWNNSPLNTASDSSLFFPGGHTQAVSPQVCCAMQDESPAQTNNPSIPPSIPRTFVSWIKNTN